MNMKALPKIELHLHLDCSLSFDIVSHLAPAVRREEYDTDYVGPSRCANLAEFLARAPKGFSLMQSVYALKAVTADLFEQLQDRWCHLCRDPVPSAAACPARIKSGTSGGSGRSGDGSDDRANGR